MKESYLRLGEDTIFLRHSELEPGRPAILFIHGLGESSLCFQEAFEKQRLVGFNLLAPDLAGYGRSSGSSDYGFSAHLTRLDRLLEKIEENGTALDRVIVVGHSMGADLATLFCASQSASRVAALVNIEGDLTEHDLFISGKAVEADRSGRFNEWFEDEFKRRIVYEEFGEKYESCRRYYASLCFARSDAFLENASELHRRSTSSPLPVRSEFGRIYLDLPIPKVFCFGQNSLSDASRKFIAVHSLESVYFADAFHWPMIDRSDGFYRWLYEYAQSLTLG